MRTVSLGCVFTGNVKMKTEMLISLTGNDNVFVSLTVCFSHILPLKIFLLHAKSKVNLRLMKGCLEFLDCNN